MQNISWHNTGQNVTLIINLVNLMKDFLRKTFSLAVLDNGLTKTVCGEDCISTRVISKV